MSNSEYERGIPEIIEKITSLRTKIELIEFSTLFQNTAKNNVILLHDLIRIFGKMNSNDSLQMVYRFIIIDRLLFVDTISAFEYEIRCFIKEETDTKLENIQKKLEKNPIMSISKLILSLKNSKYLNDTDYKKLDGLFAIRNMIVHHHAIVNNTKDKVPEEFQRNFSDFTIGKRMKGKAGMFLNLMTYLIDFYLIWYREKTVLKLIYENDKKANIHSKNS